MSTIIVDDLRNPKPGLFAADAVIFRDSASACSWFRESMGTGQVSIDSLWLDHDLGGEDTTRPFVAMLEEAAYEHAALSIGTVYVHTSNSVGAAWIEAALSRYFTTRTVFAGDYFTD